MLDTELQDHRYKAGVKCSALKGPDRRNWSRIVDRAWAMHLTPTEIRTAACTRISDQIPFRAVA
jgi:hypothetical protein